MIPLTDAEAGVLAHRVVKQSSGVSVRIGRTNGHPVLHLIQRRNDDAGRVAESRTIHAEAEWSYHEWNKHTNKQKESNTTNA